MELEREKALIDQQEVFKLIKPSAVMFDPVQKSMLIGFFTNRDIFLNKLIPMLSVYLDQTKNCMSLLVKFQQKPQKDQSELNEIQETYKQAFNMADIILKELKSIYVKNVGDENGEEAGNLNQVSLEEARFYLSDESVVGYRHMQIKDKARVLVDIN